MSVLAIVAGIVLLAVAIFSPDPPLTYAWAAGLPLLMVGIAGEHRLARQRRRRPIVPPRGVRIRVDDVRGFEYASHVEIDGRVHRLIAVDRIENELYVEDAR